MEKKFYVYVHIRPDTGAVFYAGKGQGFRAKILNRNNRHHKNVVAKLKRDGLSPEIRILARGLSEVCAFTFERALIHTYRSIGAKLCNLTDGGEGSSGYTHDAEARAKIGDASRGKPKSPETRAKMVKAQRGRKVSESTLENMSKAGRALWDDPEYRQKMIEVHRSPETRERHSKANDPNKKPVICLDNGVVYPSVHAAAQALGVPLGGVSNVCRGRARHAYGYRFCYENPAERPQEKEWPGRAKAVFCVETGKTYESAKSAAAELGLHASNIAVVCKGRQPKTGGYTFRYANG